MIALILILALGLTMAITFSLMLAYTMDLINVIGIFVGVVLCVAGGTGMFVALGDYR